MKQAQFEQRYRGLWQGFSNHLEQLEKGDSPAADTFSAEYRQLCQLQSLARARHYSQQLQHELNTLALRGYHQLYGTPRPFLRQLIAFFVTAFPSRVRRDIRYVAAASACFYLPALFVGGLLFFFPELVFHLFDPAQVVNYEQMYEPGQQRLGEMREAETDLMMFGFYLKNNIGVGFRTFAGGLLCGVGSLFFLIYNGFAIGGVAGYLSQLGYGLPFWTFVAGHSALELTAITLAGAAGLKMGHGLIAPGQLTRIEALKQQSVGAIELIYGVVLMLIGAAFIEAFWSSNGSLPVPLKFAVGIAGWMLIALYFGFGGRVRREQSSR